MAFGQSLGSSLGGLAGTAASSFIPGAGLFAAPVGNALGSAAGGYLGGLFDSNGNSTMNQQQGQQNGQQQYPQGPYGVQRFSPDVQSQLMQLLQGGGIQGSQPAGNQQSFQPIEDQARSQFNTQTIPTLAERFTSMGGGQRSSAFQGALGSAGSGLELGLGALRSQHEQGLGTLRSQHGMQLLQTLLPYLEQTYQQRQPGFGENFGVAAASSIGPILSLLAMYIGSQYNNKIAPGSDPVQPNNNKIAPGSAPVQPTQA